MLGAAPNSLKEVNMSKDPEERLTELEIQIAHVQRTYDQLNEVVTEQTLEIDRLQRRLGRLADQLERMKAKPEMPPDPLDEKPPHY